MSTGSASQSNMCGRLHGPRDLRVEPGDPPTDPPSGHVRVRITAVGICGSDLHTYRHGRIGDTTVESPVILGHEFGGVVDAVGQGDTIDGNQQPLHVGTRVAVDPAQPCGACKLCHLGHPNLCLHLKFCGQWPHDGALQGYLNVPAATCFAIPDTIDDANAALLETLGVAIHAVNLAHLTRGVTILGAGRVGLCILQIARVDGEVPIFVTDRQPQRLALAEQWGGSAINIDRSDPVETIRAATGGLGVDVAIEAANAGPAVQQAADVVRPGGRLVLVGIPDDDQLNMLHSTARRKGLTIRMSRRMKHTYPQAIGLMQDGIVDLTGMVTHRFPLDRAPEAFAMNDAYGDGVIKVMIEMP